MFQIGLKKFLKNTKIKYTNPWRYVITDLRGKELIIKNKLKLKKELKVKLIKCIST